MELQPYQPYFATYGKPVETPLQLSYESDVQFLGWQKTYPVSKGKESCFKGEIWLAEIVFHRRNSVFSPLKHGTNLFAIPLQMERNHINLLLLRTVNPLKHPCN